MYIIKKNQREILELKNTMNEKKNVIESSSTSDLKKTKKESVNSKLGNYKLSSHKGKRVKKKKERKIVTKTYRIYGSPYTDPVYALWESQKEEREKNGQRIYF